MYVCNTTVTHESRNGDEKSVNSLKEKNIFVCPPAGSTPGQTGWPNNRNVAVTLSLIRL
jgi:hypothetical protein